MNLRRIVARLRALWTWFARRGTAESAMDEEFAAHIEMRAADLERSGMSPSQARRRARMEFGGTERFKEEARRVRGFPTLESAIRDVRQSLRSFRRTPAFTVAAVLSLGLGVGASTAIFSVVDATLLRPLPFADPDRLVDVWEAHRDEGWTHGRASPGDFFAWRERVDAFAGVAGYGTGVVTVSGDGMAEAVRGGWVTGTFFDVLGVPAALGRGFRPGETWQGEASVVVLSDELWARRWGRDPGVVGTTVLVDEVPRRVVGIMPPGLSFPEVGTELWLPMEWDRAAPGQRWWHEERFVFVVGRLRDGVSDRTARAQLARVARSLEEERPETNRGVEADFTRLDDTLTGAARAPLGLLFAATGLLLLMTCVNLANLLLVRAGRRRDEIGLRAALGASRLRIASQLLAESLTLATLGGLLGVALGVLGRDLLLALQPPGAWRLVEAPIQGRALAFSALVSVACGAVFGLAPVARATAIVRGRTARAGGGGTWRSARRSFVVAQVALSVVLVAGAGLILRTFLAVRDVDPGFEIAGRTSVSLVLPPRYRADADLLAFVDAVSARMTAIPGVAGVAYASRAPFGGTSTATPYLEVEGRERGESGLAYAVRLVGPTWFRTAGVPLLEGRWFDDRDAVGAEPVVVVNRTLARRVFGAESPVGHRLSTDDRGERTWLRVVGVVGDEHQEGLRAPARPEILYPYRWLPSRRVTFLVAGRGQAVAGAALRAAVAEVDGALAPYALRSLEDVYRETLATERLLLTLIGGFAVLAVMLAALGVYGVTAETAQRRTREVGIRVALGARPEEAVRFVLVEGLGLACAGIAVGLSAAWVGGRWMTSVVFGVDPRDAATLLTTALVLGLVAAAACALPVVRAARLDPSVVMRSD